VVLVVEVDLPERRLAAARRREPDEPAPLEPEPSGSSEAEDEDAREDGVGDDAMYGPPSYPARPARRATG